MWTLISMSIHTVPFWNSAEAVHMSRLPALPQQCLRFSWAKAKLRLRTGWTLMLMRSQMLKPPVTVMQKNMMRWRTHVEFICNWFLTVALHGSVFLYITYVSIRVAYIDLFQYTMWLGCNSVHWQLGECHRPFRYVALIAAINYILLQLITYSYDYNDYQY